MIVAVLALVFSILFIWYSRNTGHSFWAYWAPYLRAAAALLLGHHGDTSYQVSAMAAGSVQIPG